MHTSYDNAGQLLSAVGQEAGGASRWQEQYGYAYDAAGNLNHRTNNTLVQTFNVNTLNELGTINHSGTLTVAGMTTSPATSVTVNGSNAVLYADATFASTNQPVVGAAWNTYAAVGQNSAGLTTSNTVSMFMPKTDNMSYDLNGNLLAEYSAAGGTNRQFAYDDENELISVTVTNQKQSVFAYDGKMRRRIDREYLWNAGAWQLTAETYYVYDGNLVIQERLGGNIPAVTYTRGPDLSGSLQGAGGVGGLLGRTDFNGSTYYHADGNGNVTMLLDASQNVAANYKYDPYGFMLAMSGQWASLNTYRFSSKEWNNNSGLYYYLYRFYDPNLQRWPNTDPLVTESITLGLAPPRDLIKYSVNVFEFIHQNPINRVDYLGLAVLEKQPGWTVKDCLAYAQRVRSSCKRGCAELGWTGTIASLCLGLIPTPPTIAGGVAGGVAIAGLWDRCNEKCDKVYDGDVQDCVDTYTGDGSSGK